MSKGRFIVFEGLDGAGKTTQLKEFGKVLSTRSIPFVETREIGGTFICEQIRDIFLGINEEPITLEAQLLLVYAARVQHLQQKILPLLSKGAWVICDRFNWSTFAYQGAGNKLGFSKILALENMFLAGFNADFTIYLDVDPVIGLKRAKERSMLDSFEQKELNFFNTVRAMFQLLHLNSEGRSVLIDANQSVEKITKLAIDACFINLKTSGE